uniref:Long neurotoxin LNTX1 n=1 Tax=Ophiophagus hannah TaxID=8665 RepID=3L2X1_OPHHA|nr:RecName: Full=Long neurotoxin LNTX1; Flags: Precursor [Ophiophagus hannah]ABB83621.1 long chain neurotoxin precursor [Ophiophagus hannah]
MKILLLTLVVVTIMCLDLGYTTKCYKTGERIISETCPPGQDLCYMKTWCDVFCGSRGRVIELGCTATCPTVKPHEQITCCSTDNCNPHPKMKQR